MRRGLTFTAIACSVLAGQVALGLALRAAPADAAFPGENGPIAFTSWRDLSLGDRDNTEIYAMNADGSNQINLTRNGAGDFGPAFSPDGTRIAFTSYRDSGFGEANAEIYVMDADGSDQIRLTSNPADDFGPAFSPDGTRIAFTSWRDGSFADGNTEIYVMDADGSNQTRLTTNPASDAQPVFSPDGTAIAFNSERDGNTEIYAMDANGSNPINLTNDAAIDSYPAYSPDGTTIAFASYRDGSPGPRIYAMDADGSNPINLTDGFGTEPAYSPDGSRIAFTRDGIYAMDADGQNQTPLTTNVTIDEEPDWGPAPVGPATIAELIASVRELELRRGIEHRLLAKLKQARRSLDKGRHGRACRKLGAFAHRVAAQSGKKIAAADATELIDEATAVRQSLGCGPARRRSHW